MCGAKSRNLARDSPSPLGWWLKYTNFPSIGAPAATEWRQEVRSRGFDETMAERSDDPMAAGANTMNHEQRLADVERILADLASTVRVLGDHERLLGQHQIRLEENQIRLEEIQLQMGARMVEIGARIVELTDNQATTQSALQALIAQIDRFIRGQ